MLPTRSSLKQLKASGDLAMEVTIRGNSIVEDSLALVCLPLKKNPVSL